MIGEKPCNLPGGFLRMSKSQRDNLIFDRSRDPVPELTRPGLPVHQTLEALLLIAAIPAIHRPGVLREKVLRATSSSAQVFVIERSECSTRWMISIFSSGVLRIIRSTSRPSIPASFCPWHRPQGQVSGKSSSERSTSIFRKCEMEVSIREHWRKG
jgi:hypothetical protein